MYVVMYQHTIPGTVIYSTQSVKDFGVKPKA